MSATSHFTNAMITQQSSQSQGAPSKNYASIQATSRGSPNLGFRAPLSTPQSALPPLTPSTPSSAQTSQAPSSPADITTLLLSDSGLPSLPRHPSPQTTPPPFHAPPAPPPEPPPHPFAFAAFFRGRTPAPLLAHLDACTPGLPLPEEPPRLTSKSSAVVAIPAG